MWRAGLELGFFSLQQFMDHKLSFVDQRFCSKNTLIGARAPDLSSPPQSLRRAGLSGFSSPEHRLLRDANLISLTWHKRPHYKLATKLYSSACLLWVYLQIIFFLVHSQGASVIGSPPPAGLVSVLSTPAILQLDSPNTIGTIQGRKLTTLAWTVCWVGRFGSSPTWWSGCWSICWSRWSFTSSLGYGENAPHCRSNLTKIINICISIFQSDNLLSESCSTLRWPLFLFLSATRVSWVLPWDDPGQNRQFAFGISRVRLRIGSRWSEVPEETHRTSVISFYGRFPKKAGKAVLSYTQEIQHTKKIGPKGLFQPSSVAKAIYDGVYEAATTNQMITRSLRKSK